MIKVFSKIWITIVLIILVAGGFFAWQKYGWMIGTVAKIQSLEIVPSQKSEEGIVYSKGAKAIVTGNNLAKVELYQRGGGTGIYTLSEGGLIGMGLKTETIKGEEKWEITSLPIERFMRELCGVGFDKKGNKVGEVCLYNVAGTLVEF